MQCVAIYMYILAWNNMKILNNYLNNELKPIFKLQYLGNDVLAAISLVIFAIPLSLAVAIASDANPGVGIISAIIGGILGAIFGGTRLGVTGPAVAMSILIANSIELYGFSSIFIIGIICGILQIASGVFGLGRFIKLVPLSLILAFTAGIGFLIFFSQLPLAFNDAIAPHSNPILVVIQHLNLYFNKTNLVSFIILIATVSILKFSPKVFPRAIVFLVAVAAPTLVVYFFNLKNVTLVGTIPHNLIRPQSLDFSHIYSWSHLLITAIEVFLLASLETLLSSNAVDLIGEGDLHNSNQELVGQGIANIGVAIFGGIPVTGVIARSSVNILAGGKTRRSALFHSLIILILIYTCPYIIEIIPIAVLVGVLVAAAITMMSFGRVVELWKLNKPEFAVYIICFLAIITTGLISGIEIGLFAAFIIIGFRMLKTKTHVKLWNNKNVLRVSLNGSITFWSCDKLLTIEEFATTHKELKFVIFEFDRLHHIDTTGATQLIKIANNLNEANIKVIFHGLNDKQRKVIEMNNLSDKFPYIITLTEGEIKDTLESYGISHSASDVLKHGMAKFMNEYAEDNKLLISTLAQGQKPHTLLITCSDSRLDPNVFFGANLGELFIVRNVGNVVPPYNTANTYSEVAAIEFALNALEIRNIVLCAHTECGAVKASIPMTDLPYTGLNNWLTLIRDGFREHKPLNMDMGVKINLLHQVKNLKTYSVVRKLLESKELTLSAWIYDVHSGHMLEWIEEKNDFVPLV
jgi:carbonic anhydrase